MSTTEITAADVKALRDRTGAAMMDCKAALTEAGGDARQGGRAPAGQGPGLGREAQRPRRPARASSPPTSTRTARSARWSRSSARPTSSPATTTSGPSPARSRCTSPPRRRASSPPTRSPRTRRPPSGTFRGRRPPRRASRENVREQIVEGQLAKWRKEIALLDQEHVNADKHDGKTIETAARGGLGEDRREHPDRPLRPLRGRSRGLVPARATLPIELGSRSARSSTGSC